MLVCNHSNERQWEALSCGAVNFAVQGGSNFGHKKKKVKSPYEHSGP